MYPTVKYSRIDPNNFFKTMRSRVNQYFAENNISKNANVHMYTKTGVMLSLFFLPYFLMLFLTLPAWAAIICYLVMGFGVSGIGLSIMHDANHGSYSKVKWINQLFSHTMDLIGCSSFTWKVQHNVLHHSFTNIYELDEDIDDKPFLRLSPHGKLKKHHRYQHYYALVLYSLSTISWVFMKDFRQLVTYNRNGMTEKSGLKPRREAFFMIFTKVLYLCYIIALPIALGIAWWAVAIGFVLMHMVAGLVVTIIFQLAHVVEGPRHFVPQETGTMENTWAIHQLSSTANFAPKNRFITWFVGGLNFQIEHHLFPSICHVHYKKISEIVRSTAQEFGLPYYEYPRFREALASHLKVLKQLGTGATASLT